MKEYIKPDVQYIDFTSEAVATGGVDGTIGTESLSGGSNPLA